jgi:hypothetical protein
MPVYEIERGGVVIEIDSPQFPTRDQINRAFASLPTARPEDFTPQQAQPEGSAIGRFASGAGEMLNPAKIAQGLYQTVRHPIDTVSAIASAHGEEAKKTGEAFSEGRYSEAVGHGLATILPVLGPAAARIGEEIAETGDVATGVGRGVGLAAPVAAARPLARAAGRAIGATAKPLVRSAIKPTVTAARQQAGASATGLNAQANRLASFIVENKIGSREQAQAIVDAAEKSVQSAVSGATKATDAPQRAARYLRALSQSASRQGLPADDVATIRAKAAELLNDSPLSETVTSTVMQPSPTGLVTASGQPVMVPTQVPSRALRTDVMPDEALELARGSGRWGNRKAWGEQKGASREASKAVERAERDAVKAAVPETKPLLRRQGQAIQAREAMDRMAFREGNREPISPFDVTTGAVEIATGRAPVLSVARHLLRENKLKFGIWAKRLETAIANNDEATAALILDRFGVLRGAGATSPSGSQNRTTGPASLSPLPAQ